MNIDLFIFLLFINIISFFLCAYDKYLAKKKKLRISEKLFIFLSILGGFIGFILSSKIFRHKTKHNKLLFIVYLTSIPWFLFLIATIYDKIILR